VPTPGDAGPLHAAPASQPKALLELTKSLQSELRRVGCGPTTISELWDSGAKEALAAFNRAAKSNFDDTAPTVEALLAVSKETDIICGIVCGKGTHVAKGQCIPIVCQAGESLNSSGACEKISPPVVKIVPPRKTKRALPPNRCLDVGGANFC